MSALQFNKPDNLISMEDSAQSLAPRSAQSMEEMMAMLAGDQFSNDSTAAASAAMSRSWRQGTDDDNYVTSTVAPMGGHRRNH
ncbi:hypothetical protein BGZ98_005514, partial [Dissophora globulifera]